MLSAFLFTSTFSSGCDSTHNSSGKHTASNQHQCNCYVHGDPPMNCSYLRERWGKRKEERGKRNKKVIERILMAIGRIEEGAGKEKGNIGKQHLVKGARVRLCIVQKEKGLTTRRFLISKNEKFHLSNLPISTNSSCLQPANLAAKSCARRTAARHQWYRIFTCGGEGAGCPKCCVPSEIKVWYE